MSNLKHGMSRTKIYMVWKEMRARCERTTHKQYKSYGGRGITVCDGWSSFVEFNTWAMANGYVEGLSIDRVDNDKGYHPDNCEWIHGAVNSSKDKLGEFNSNSKLSSADVLGMRRLYAAGGTSQSKLAEAFGVGRRQVTKIINKKQWGHI